MRYGSYLAPRVPHKWLISDKTVVGILSLGLVLTFIGVVLVAVGHVSTGALVAIGGVLLGIGLFLLVLSLFLCCHAYCIWYVRDAETQTVMTYGIDNVDASMSPMTPTYAVIDKRSPPNGVLKDGSQVGTLTKKHVTISPRTPHDVSVTHRTPTDVTTSPKTPNDVFTEYYANRQADMSKLSDRSKTDTLSSFASVSEKAPSSVSNQKTQSAAVTGRPQLASLAYLKDAYPPTPYSSLSHKPPRAPQTVQVPIHVQTHGSYGYTPSRYGDNTKMAPVRPYYMERARAGSNASSTQFPQRRHSDDDYDNAMDMVPMLAYQSYQHSPQSIQQSSGYQHSPQSAKQSSSYSYKQSEQTHQQAPPSHQQAQPSHQQAQPSQSHWKTINPSYDDPPPAQPLVYPSARRPMTFEQLSSSKVSIYDNIHMGFREEVD